MSTDPDRRVSSTPTCKVHSLANLYIGGSAVFPTSGANTPTLTLVALALRLADHLDTVHQALTAHHRAATRTRRDRFGHRRRCRRGTSRRCRPRPSSSVGPRLPAEVDRGATGIERRAFELAGTRRRAVGLAPRSR